MPYNILQAETGHALMASFVLMSFLKFTLRESKVSSISADVQA